MINKKAIVFLQALKANCDVPLAKMVLALRLRLVIDFTFLRLTEITLNVETILMKTIFQRDGSHNDDDSPSCLE